MNVKYFLDRRIKFLRQLYSITIEPYIERQRKIEAGEEPFSPIYIDDSGEPAYLNEWLEANESIQVLGQNCISMLTATLKIYLETWKRLIGKPTDKAIEAAFKKNWLAGYMMYFEKHSGISFEDCPINISMLEELILARNRVQHPDSIFETLSQYGHSDLKKMRHPFFIDESDFEIVSKLSTDESIELLTMPNIHITPEKFDLAVESVEILSNWLEKIDD